jgi:PAS domain S-box-containing protein
MQNQKVLERLGYSAKEAKVYLMVLSLGECRVSDVALKLKQPRTSIQAVIDRLHKDGVMSFYTMRGRKYWAAENPERLMTNLKSSQEMLADALPKLSLIRERGRKKKCCTTDVSIGIFRVFADSSNSPVLITDSNMNIQYVNTSWEKLFGYTLQDVIGQTPLVVKSGKTPEDVYHAMHKALKSEVMFQSADMINKSRSGKLIRFLTTIFPVRHNGSLYYIQILNSSASYISAVA